MNTLKVGDRLCLALDERGWTMRHLATLTGVEYATLRGIAYQDHPIDERVAVALSDALGTSVETWAEAH